MDDLYFCQEQRLVCVDKQVIKLTAKEFDILTLLITHPKRVFTYELIMELVWNEDYSYCLLYTSYLAVEKKNVAKQLLSHAPITFY